MHVSTVDTEGAGEGSMEIAVSADGNIIPNKAQAVGEGKYQVAFVARQAITHAVTVIYNGQHVSGKCVWCVLCVCFVCLCQSLALSIILRFCF